MAHWKQEKKELEEQIAKLKEANATKQPETPVTPVVVDAAAGEVVETKTLSGRPPTKPWTKKDGVYRPFRRDFFKMKEKHKGFRPFFAQGNERIEELIERGYRIADPKDYGGLVDKVIDDGSALGNRIVRHGMTLMEIPQEEYDAVQQAKEDHRKALMKRSRTEFKDVARKVGAETGHEIKVSDDTKE